MVRSLDLIVDNTVERVQAVRLARTLLSVAPRLFPADLTRCLLAITADGPIERDRLWMITLATVTQLCKGQCLATSMQLCKGRYPTLARSFVRRSVRHTAIEAHRCFRI